MYSGQAAPIYWIYFITIIFGIILMVTYLSPMFEIVKSTMMNVSSHLPLNGSVNTTATRWTYTWNIVPMILILGLLFAMVVVASKREFDTGEAGYYG